MDPVIFTSREEQQCVTNFTSGINTPSEIQPDKLTLSVNWKGNLNYWTGGKQGSKGTWGWCAGAQSQPFTANLSWAPNQPEYAKDNENCLHMRVFQNKSGLLLNDRDCKDKYIYACKVN